ncbi:RASSF8 family protein [Megaselia abdita]
MELKVWVEGIQRIVCGVNTATTCQDVVFALAHATGKVGRFTLIERWRNNERLLGPSESPMKILLKWGEYANDVQFILQRSDQIKKEEKQRRKSLGEQQNLDELSPLDRAKEIRKSFGLENVGIVKPTQSPAKEITDIYAIPNKGPKSEKPPTSTQKPADIEDIEIEDSIYQTINTVQSSSNEINLADVRESLSRKTTELSQENLMMDTLNGNIPGTSSSPLISANGALVPPPYRNPPPPRNSPLSVGVNNNNEFGGEAYFQGAQYTDLVQVIKFQRDKINTQQSELSKYDAEISYWEAKERDQAQELEAISREITKVDKLFRQGSEQLQSLQYVEEENELVKQQEKTLKSEITLLRSKLANCETELLQCKNKIRLIMDDVQMEQRALINRKKDSRQSLERDFLGEVERIQMEIDEVIQNTETSSKTTDNLKKEINLIENAISEKKRQVEQLVNEMKEVNLQSLAVTSTEDIHHLIEGSTRPGSTRRIIGSPRQLENAVPTSKNPHGVWV